MHKLKVGDLVRVNTGQGRKLAGAYEIVRLLPADKTGTPIYQIKAAHESHMRVVAEHHIQPEGREEQQIQEG